MIKVKDLIVKPITASAARAIVKRIHYSGKVVANSVIHFGVFHGTACLGVMQFGSPIDKRRMQPLVAGTGWNEFMELNRMAFHDSLPKNSESRCLSVAFRLIKKHYTHIKWVVSFADSTQCGDGTIYRAAGFDLIGVKKNSSLLRMPDGSVVAMKTLDNNPDPNKSSKRKKKNGAVPLQGFQIKYIYFLDKTYRKKLSVPLLPFSTINEKGAGMYKGIPRGTKAIAGNHPASGGAIPTPTLQNL